MLNWKGNVQKTVMLLLGSACDIADVVFLELFVGRSDVEKKCCNAVDGWMKIGTQDCGRETYQC
jgi:hypothetical protein